MQFRPIHKEVLFNPLHSIKNLWWCIQFLTKSRDQIAATCYSFFKLDWQCDLPVDLPVNHKVWHELSLFGLRELRRELSNERRNVQSGKQKWRNEGRIRKNKERMQSQFFAIFQLMTGIGWNRWIHHLRCFLTTPWYHPLVTKIPKVAWSGHPTNISCRDIASIHAQLS